MNIISIYRLSTGQYQRSVGTQSEEMLWAQVKEGEKGFLNLNNPSAYYLDVDGVSLVSIPAKPNEYDIFDYETKQWVDPRTPEQQYQDAVDIVIPQRNELLYQSDWTQIPNNPLTAEKQQEWAAYRQELRDITMQSGYPFTVIWPTPPQG